VSGGLQARIAVGRPGGFRLEVELDIPPGRTVALLGPNGAGKSTTVAALAGLLPLDAGRIELADRVLDDPEAGVWLPPEERRVGVAFQDGLLFPHLSVLENVAFGLRARGTPGPEARTRAAGWVDRVGLAGMEERRPGALSGGQARRAALARALAAEPDLLLLDEPLAAVDVPTRGALRRLLARHLERFAGPRLLITHEPGEAFQLADEIHVVEAGRTTQIGTPEELRLRPRTPYVAELAGSNLVVGRAADGTVEVDGTRLSVVAPGIRGRVRLAIRPSAVSLHRREPAGSPRNRWSTVVERVEDRGGRVRVLTGPPLPLLAEITPAALRELALAPGTAVWVSLKATDIGVEAEAGPEPEAGSPPGDGPQPRGHREPGDGAAPGTEPEAGP
jgi:molybdate transport system ATP-binding protein